MELSPGSFRTFVVGTAYQLGNLASSASSTIEATIGERFPLAPLVNAKTGKSTPRYNYGKVICIFLGCVYAYLIILVLVGPENRGAPMEVEYDDDMRAVAGTQFEEALGLGGAQREKGGVEVDSEEKRSASGSGSGSGSGAERVEHAT